MQVILLERIGKLGQMGDTVTVKDGYARNFLLPQKKAMRATEANMKVFESQRAQLEARNLELKSEAEKVAEKLEGQSFIIIRQAGDTGQLYGSASTRDVSDEITKEGFSVDRRQILLEKPLKALGVHPLRVQLHPEVEVGISVNIARSTDEAERQARGEDVTVVVDEVMEIETYSEDDDYDDDRGGEGPAGEEAEVGESEAASEGREDEA